MIVQPAPLQPAPLFQLARPKMLAAVMVASKIKEMIVFLCRYNPAEQ